MDFYSQIGESYPEVLDEMARDFASCRNGLVGNILEGPNITDALREILGDRQFDRNPKWTLRGTYFKHNNPEMLEHRTVAHASTSDEVEKDFKVFKKYGILINFIR